MGYLLVWKIYVSGALALLFIPAVILRPSLRNVLLALTGFFYCAADILINPVPFLGILLFGVGHLVLLINMMLRYRFILKKFWIFLGISIAFLIAAYFISASVEKVAPFVIPGVIYGLILLAAVLKSSSDSKLLFFAMLVFLASDILLVFNFTMNTSLFLKITGLVVYYISVAMIVLSILFGPEKDHPLLRKGA